MRISAREIKEKGIMIRKDLYEQAVGKYTAIMNGVLFDLYKSYYLSDVSEFDMSTIAKIIKDEYREYLPYFMSQADATYDWSAKRFEYVLRVAETKKLDLDFRNLIRKLFTVVDAQETLDALANIGQRSKILSKSKDSKATDVIYPRFGVSGTVLDFSKLNFNNKNLLEISGYNSNTLFACNTKKVMYYKAVSALLNIEKPEIDELLKKHGRLFSDSLTFEDECYFLEYFLSGKVKCTGYLKTAMAKQLQSENNFTITKAGVSTVDKFVNTIFTQSIDERCDLLATMRNKISENTNFKAVYPVFMDNNAVYFAASIYKDENSGNHLTVKTKNMVTMVSRPKEDEVIIPKKFFGGIVFDYIAKTALPMYYTMSNISGEYISEADVFSNRYYTEVKPVQIKVIEKTTKKYRVSYVRYYNIKDVYYSDQRNDKGELVTKTLESSNEYLAELDCMSEAEMFNLFGVKDKHDFYGRIAQIVSEQTLAFTDEDYKTVVSELICAYTYFQAGLIEYDLVNISRRIRLTTDKYDIAKFEASNLVSLVQGILATVNKRGE